MIGLKSEEMDLDHILESVYGLKLNDYLLDFKKHSLHISKHYKGEESEDEFIEALVRALNNLFSYIKYLEGKIK